MSSRLFKKPLIAARQFGQWLAKENYFFGKLVGASAAGILTIVLLGVIFLISANEKVPRDQLRGTALETLRITSRIESDLNAMENAHRDFLASGEAPFRLQFDTAHVSLDSRIEALRSIIDKDSAQAGQLAALSEMLKTWDLRYAQPQLQARWKGTSVVGIVPFSEAKVWLDGVRASLRNFRQLGTEALVKTNHRASMQLGGFSALCAVAIGFLIASSCYSLGVFRRHLKKIEQAEAQTRAIVESTRDGVITVDSDGAIHSVNPATERLFAQRSTQIVGRNIAALIPDLLTEGDLHELGDNTVTTVGHRNGAPPFPIEVSLSNMHFEGTKRFALIVRDVAERKRGEETLRHIGMGLSAATGEEFLKSLVMELSRALRTEYAFVVELHRKGDRLTSTLTLAEKGRMQSCAQFEISGSACGDVLQSGFRAYIGGARARFPADGLLEGLGVDTFVAMPLLDHCGQGVGVMGVLDHRRLEGVQVIESTLQIFAARAGAEIERKRFDEDLAAEKERLAVTLRSIGDGFITTDNGGRVLMLNNVAERLTGWTQEHAAGRPLTDVFRLRHERTRRPMNDAIMAIVGQGSAEELAGPAVIVAHDGTERVIETNVSPIKDGLNEKVGVVLVFRDVTERMRSEEERRKNEKLESLGIAAGGIAHDFNNLLTAILGNVSIALMHGKTGDPITDRLVAAKKASLRAQELAQQLLTFAKGGSPIKKTASIAQLVRDTVGFSLRGSNVRCDFTIPDDLWPAEVDPGQISQVIQNLAINADQAMPAGGTLHVDCDNVDFSATNPHQSLKAGRFLRIAVRDEGIGIPEENLKKIFDPYFTTKPKGSGLGLATTYSIIKNHGGVVEVASKPGEGTAFCIYLPASDKPVAVVDAPALEAPKHLHGG
ncbi:MAG: PAS domain S-box protein, partial [Chthoniobacteraceae bacterium]